VSYQKLAPAGGTIWTQLFRIDGLRFYRRQRILPGGPRKSFERSGLYRKPNLVSQEKLMERQILRTIALRSFALLVILGGAWQAQAQDGKTPYPSMAPLDQYLMERNAEIALANGAAPESISRDAEVMVLGRHGYETVVKGKKAFVCVVARVLERP
jgi:hypothetical protein